jgi:hypothetical protein
MSEPAWKAVVVESEPAGAGVYLNDKPAGQTPLLAYVPTQENLAVTFFSPGLPAKTVVVLTEPNRAAAANMFFLPGFIIDLVSDRFRRFPVDRISVRLTEGPRAVLYNDGTPLGEGGP